MINYLRSKPKPLVLQAQKVMNALFKEFGEVKITMITVGELHEGIYLSNNPAKNLRIVENFLKKFKIMPFSKECAIECGRISAELTKIGKPIGNFDELIASIVIHDNDVLYTRNIQHFEKVSHLKLNYHALN